MNYVHILTIVTLFISTILSSACVEAQSYADITLDQAITIALEKNRDITQAREETFRAKFQITEAASGAYHILNGLWTMDRNLKPQVFVIQFPDDQGVLRKNRLKVGTDHTMNIGANLTQPIWVGGKVGTALKAAKIYKNISDQTFNTVRQNVVTGVASAFHGILLAEEMVKISNESLLLAEKHLKNVEILHSAGSATDYDLLRARVHVENLKPDLLEAENTVKVSLLKLKDFIGLESDTPLTITGSLSEPDSAIFSTARDEIAFSNRPDLKATEFQIDLSQKAVRLAVGDFLPTLTAGTTFAYMGNFDTFKYDSADWNPYWFANVSLTFPIFSGFKNYARYKQAKALRQLMCLGLGFRRLLVAGLYSSN